MLTKLFKFVRVNYGIIRSVNTFGSIASHLTQSFKTRTRIHDWRVASNYVFIAAVKVERLLTGEKPRSTCIFKTNKHNLSVESFSIYFYTKSFILLLFFHCWNTNKTSSSFHNIWNMIMTQHMWCIKKRDFTQQQPNM